ncbi:ALDH-like protein [Hymenopellis radicata]|nr:ALDH-like protein [Hymenopellis radicata]
MRFRFSCPCSGGIYDAFVEKFSAAKDLAGTACDPVSLSTQRGPQVSQVQMDADTYLRWRVLGYLDPAKKVEATIHIGGERHGQKRYFVQPTLFSEIVGTVGSLLRPRLKTTEIANTVSLLLTENNARAIRVAHALEAGSLFINNYGTLEINMPFWGSKRSGHGRELAEYALQTYPQVKAVHVTQA